MNNNNNTATEVAKVAVADWEAEAAQVFAPWAANAAFCAALDAAITAAEPVVIFTFTAAELASA